MDEFAGKVAVITGGASGLGLAAARRFAREGMKIVLADIEEPALERALHELASGGTDVTSVRTDVTRLDDCQRLAEATWGHFGGCHLLFNNAGVAVGGLIQDMTHQDWEWCLNVDLWGPIHMVEAFVPRMIALDQGGHIVNTASFAGMVPNAGLGVYCVAKYGVVALSECLYRDLSPHGIGVSVLCPMRVATNIDDSARNRPPELGGRPRPSPEATTDDRQMAGRTIAADEVAEMILDGVRKRKLYIFTHPESRGFIQRRFARIDRAFED